MAGLGDLGRTLRAFEESIGTRGPRQLAERVAAELQDAGPNWTGEFMNAWRIIPGDGTVPATVGRPEGAPRPPRVIPPTPPIRPTVPPVSIGRRFGSVLTTNKTLYTIGNASRHRDVAMDIVPGRTPPVTAPRGWFETYIQGGELDRTMRVVLDSSISEAMAR